MIKKHTKIQLFVIIIITSFACTNNSAQTDKYLSQTENFIQDSVYGNDLKSLSKFGDTPIFNRYLDEIQKFEKDDSLFPNRKVDIIFTGSSSIRKWSTLNQDMKELKVLNRGFGGSTIPEVIYYSNILIFKHNPSKIVFYAGENDIANSKADSMKVFESFVYFQKLVKQNLPNTQIYFIAIKYSPVRERYWNTIKYTNQMIKDYCPKAGNCTFVDINKFMLDKKQQVRKDIYLEDMLHLNPDGYKIWTNVIYNTIKKQNK